jgi:hypothetical protein
MKKIQKKPATCSVYEEYNDESKSAKQIYFQKNICIENQTDA